MTNTKKNNYAIVTRNANWLVDTLLTIDDFAFYEINPMQLGCKLPNPYGLDFCDEPDIIIVDISFHMWLLVNDSNNISSLFSKLRKISKYKTIIGTEGTDWFQLSRPPDAYHEIDILIKVQGTFKDIEMYNYEMGSCSTNKDWTVK